MRKKLYAALFMLSMFSSISAEQAIITVLDFQTNNVSPGDMRTIVSFLSASLFDSGEYTVIDTGQRDTILKELQFSLSGCSDESCQLELGKMLSAEFIVTGDVARVGSRHVLSARILSTETSATVNTARGIYESLDDLIDDIYNFSRQLNKRAGQPSVLVDEETGWPDGERPGFGEWVSSDKGRRILAWSFLGAGAIGAGAGTYLLVSAMGYKEDVVDPSYNAYMDETVTNYGGLTPLEYYDNLWSDYSDNVASFRNKTILSAGICLAGAASLGVSYFLFRNIGRDDDVAFHFLPGPDFAILSFSIGFR